jgi:hypothetical protein
MLGSRLIGRKLARYLVAPSNREARGATCQPDLLASILRKGDVLLVDGSSRISTAIKYLTQSTWSHAALCVANTSEAANANPLIDALVEADVVEGVRSGAAKRLLESAYANLSPARAFVRGDR